MARSASRLAAKRRAPIPGPNPPHPAAIRRDAIIGIYNAIEPWVRWGFEVATYAVGWIPYVGWLSGQIMIFYNFGERIVESLVFNFANWLWGTCASSRAWATSHWIADALVHLAGKRRMELLPTAAPAPAPDPVLSPRCDNRRRVQGAPLDAIRHGLTRCRRRSVEGDELNPARNSPPGDDHQTSNPDQAERLRRAAEVSSAPATESTRRRTPPAPSRTSCRHGSEVTRNEQLDESVADEGRGNVSDCGRRAQRRSAESQPTPPPTTRATVRPQCGPTRRPSTRPRPRTRGWRTARDNASTVKKATDDTRASVKKATDDTRASVKRGKSTTSRRE